jgi:hypothetical protein
MMNTTLITTQGETFPITLLLIAQMQRCGTCGESLADHILANDATCHFIAGARN